MFVNVVSGFDGVVLRAEPCVVIIFLAVCCVLSDTQLTGGLAGSNLYVKLLTVFGLPVLYLPPLRLHPLPWWEYLFTSE